MKKKDEKLPELVNPLQNMIMGNMPGLPQIIQNAMPVEMPRASYRQNSVGLILGNIKRNQLAKSMKAEAEMAEYSRKAVHEKLETIHEVITFSARTQNTFMEFDHQQHMRTVAREQAQLTTRNMELINENQELQNEHLKAQTTLVQTQAYIAGLEAKNSELEFKMRDKQFSEVFGEET